MCSLCFSAGVSLDRQRTENSLELYHTHPPPTLARPSSCLNHPSPVDPPLCLHLIPSPPLSTGLAFTLSSLRPLHLQLRAFLILHTSSTHKPLHLVTALLQSPYQCKCSAIILSVSLSFCILSAPWAPGLTGPYRPLWAPCHYLYVDCLFCGDHHCTARGPSHCWAELNWAELSWAVRSCTVPPCVSTPVCGVYEQGEYSTVRHAV